VAYYKKVLQPDETVKFVGHLHWMVYRHAIILLILTAVVPIGLTYVPNLQPEARQPAALVLGVLAVLFAILALLSFLRVWFVTASTEIVVTDRRILHKVGWISRRTQEINVSKVETVDVDQGISGRIFGFGSVLIHGVGGSWEPLRFIASPLQLRSAIMVG
jgi:uncharacterized membrane protein YdbT with pleckstrin-like domain